MTSAFFSTLISVVILFSAQLWALPPSKYIVLKNRIDQLELAKSELPSESIELIKQKQLEIDSLKLELEKQTLKEKVMIWNQMLSRFTQDKRTLNSALEERLGYVKLDCNPLFFKNENDFNFWVIEKVKNEDQLNKRLSFFSQKSDVIQSCINGIMDKGRKVKINTKYTDCNGYYGNDVKYEIDLKNNFITIDLKLQLIYKGKAANRMTVENKIEKSKPCIKTILANQGIDFNLSYAFDDVQKIKKPDSIINVFDTVSGHSNSENWGVLSEQGTPNTDNFICTFITHELMHRLGLGDKYFDPRCPGRVLGKGNDIMFNTSMPPNLARLSDKDVKTLIAPLCKN